MILTHNFGVPFVFHLGREETTAAVRKRVQQKLELFDEEIGKWKLAVVSFGRVEYLEEDEIVKARFRKHDNYGNWDDYLGLEHAQVPGSGRKQAARGGYADKPVTTYGQRAPPRGPTRRRPPGLGGSPLPSLAERRRAAPAPAVGAAAWGSWWGTRAAVGAMGGGRGGGRVSESAD